MKYSELHETKKHGTDSFPAEYYYIHPQHPQYEMTPHWHREFEILRVLSGSFTLFLDGVRYDLKENEAILFGSEALHTGKPKNCIYECIVFDMGMIKRKQKDEISAYLDSVFGTHTFPAVKMTKDTSLYRSANTLICALKEKEKFMPIQFCAELYLLIWELYKDGAFEESRSPSYTKKHTGKITELLDYIDENYQEALTLQKLSEISSLNPKYICRLFKFYFSALKHKASSVGSC